MKATIPGGQLVNLDVSQCYISIPTGAGRGLLVPFNNLPEISDSKSAAYNDEPIIGRSFPLKTYSYSENRVISVQIHLYITTITDVDKNLQILRALESCVYPRNQETGDSPYLPPPVCSMKCGELLGNKPLCVVLKNYNVKYPTDVAWEAATFMPFKFDIDTSWEVVYRSSQLPGQENIFNDGA